MKKDNKERLGKHTLFKILKLGMKIDFTTMPFISVIKIFTSLMYGTASAVIIFMTQRFYDSVQGLITGKTTLNGTYLAIAALGGLLLLKELLNGYDNYLGCRIFMRTFGEYSKIVHKKISKIDPVHFEDTKFHDYMQKVYPATGTILRIVGTCISIFSFYIPFFLIMSIYLYSLKPVFILIIVFIFIPVLISQLMKAGIIAKFEDNAAPERRKYDFYYNTITNKEFFKETRKLGAYNFFFIRFIDVIKKLSKLEWKADKKSKSLELCMHIFIVAGFAGILYLLLEALLAGEITPGAFAAVLGSLSMMFGIMENLVKNNIGKLSEQFGRAKNFIYFTELPEREGEDGEKDFSKGIQIDSVSFTYPNANEKSIDDITFNINAGETVAIVGENGAGKTTLIKLITGLYKPESGKVLTNGLDTSKINMRSLFNKVSGVFQRYQRYQMTLEENIRISDPWDDLSGDLTKDTSGKRYDRSINTVLSEAGVEVSEKDFPDGYDTMLSREFDGVDLSGGQWQRIAIARGLYRIHDTIILDEPTAAIDPLEESRIYDKFVKISKGKTAIIVTHRLGSAKMADKVIVMDKGKIVDIAPHEILMRRCGLYAEMYKAQAKWYEIDLNRNLI